MMFLLRRRLRRSLRQDSLQQVGWEAWLASARSVDGLVTSCTDPGWLMHLAFWRNVPRDAMMNAAVAVASSVMEAFRPIPDREWRLVSNRETGSRLLNPVLYELIETCRGMPGAPDELWVALGTWADLMAMSMEIGRGPIVEGVTPGPAHLAMLHLALAAVHADPTSEIYERMADAAARSVALCAASLPAERSRMVDELRRAFGW